MTTDITELAQSLKAAAENAIGAHERLAAYPYGEIIDISQHEGEQIDIDITDLNEFNKEANPVNILALVEALENAQQRIAVLDAELEREREKSRRVMSRIAELEGPKEKRLPEPYAYLRENDGQIQISIGAERPSDRSGGYATPWFAIYTAAGIKVEAD
ncbi:TPA: ead/Ea22-like family protein [Klebsiella pneumoniae]